MSSTSVFRVKIDGDFVEFNNQHNNATLELVNSILRTGYLVDGGILTDDKGRAVLEVNSGATYSFVHFKRRRNSFEHADEVVNGDKAPDSPDSQRNAKAVTSSDEDASSHKKSRNDSNDSIAAVSKDKKVKRKTKIDDPNAPKRPQNAYQIYSIEKTRELKLQSPQLQQKELMTITGNAWTKASEAEKASYQIKAAELKARFDEELARYIANNPNSETALAAQKLSLNKKAPKKAAESKEASKNAAKAAAATVIQESADDASSSETESDEGSDDGSSSDDDSSSSEDENQDNKKKTVKKVISAITTVSQVPASSVVGKRNVGTDKLLKPKVEPTSSSSPSSPPLKSDAKSKKQAKEAVADEGDGKKKRKSTPHADA